MINALLLLATLTLLPAQAESAGIAGAVTARQDGSALPGAEITLFRSPQGEVVARTVSGDDGTFAFRELAAGTYRMEGLFVGFAPEVVDNLVLKPGEELEVRLQLSLERLRQDVEVVSEKEDEIATTGSSVESLSGELVDVAPVKGDDFTALLPLLPGVVRAADGRIVIKGATATQGSLVLNSSTNATDPVTGDFGFNLPSDAVESVDVLPNPYAAEFGRFSSGITNILTRQGTNEWKFSANNFFPRIKARDGAIMGIGGFTPRFSARGPIIQDRLFVAQTVQYRFLKTRIPGQPDLKNDRRLESFDSFTQLNARLSDRHNLSVIASAFPRKLDFVNLDTFNALGVTANIHERGYGLAVTETSTFSPRAILESTVSFKRFDVDVYGQGLSQMVLAPDENRGNFFNIQRRKTKTWQWVESFSLFRPDWKGEHLFKFGVDVLHSSFGGSSESRPVNVLRSDGSLTRRITYSGFSAQNTTNTDFAFFAQDRWRVNDRLLLELGGRVDRDGVLGSTHFSPRLGFVIGLDGEARTFLRGGAGLFYERTPLNVKVFESYEAPTVTRFASDGETLLGPPRLFRLERAADARTPYSFTWNLEIDRRLGNRLLLKTNYLRRHGFHEFLVDPLSGPQPVLRLDTRGRSRYWELELTARYTVDDESRLIFSYVRSRSERDLNSFDAFFGNLRDPIIRPNEYSRGDTDSPHRFIAQGTVVLPGKWIVSPVIETRSGFPYSRINQDRDYVGPRNQSGRFPALFTVDLDIQRWVKVWKWNTRIGVRFFNLFNSFNPRDVQQNIDASRFGVFSNTIPRLLGLTFQIEN